jgi:hypothetical protein
MIQSSRAAAEKRSTDARARGPASRRPEKGAQTKVKEKPDDSSGVGYVPATGIPEKVRNDVPFRAAMTRLAKKYNVAEDDLYRVMAYESKHTFDPSKENELGSSAIGLIQIGDAWASEHGYTKAQLARMSRLEQLEVVDQYFYSRGLQNKDKPTITDIYFSVFRPNAPTDAKHVHAKSGSSRYRQNRSFDLDNNGEITSDEISYKIRSENMPGIGLYKAPRIRARPWHPINAGVDFALGIAERAAIWQEDETKRQQHLRAKAKRKR